MRQSIEKLFEKNRDLFLCFIDLEKAFDRVPRQRLFEVLSEYGVDGFLLEAIKSLYGKLVKEIDHRRKNGNAVASQLRSYVFNKKELSADTKLSIHRSIFRPTILYGTESWVDCGYLVHDLKVADMNVLRMIAKTSRRQRMRHY